MAPVKSTFACRCPAGFFGDRCEARECVGANPCANGAPCQQIGDRDHLCHCALGFEGANCERKTRRPANPCGALDCGEWGRCQVDAKGGNATCTCDRHYTGAECNVYQYDFCSTALYAEPCNRRGQCVNVPTGYRCECAEGFGGDYCEKDVDQCATGELKCENDGVCVNQLGHDFCKCPDGFGGRRCERKTEEDRCEEGVCLNGGHCNVASGPRALLLPGGLLRTALRTGRQPVHRPPPSATRPLLQRRRERCEEDVDECKLSDRMCLNGATCVNRKGSYECMCLSGFTGQFCEINVDDCLDNPCGPEATCVDGIDSYTCECPAGRYGHDCSLVDVCLDNPCVHGNCSITSDGKTRCECASPWIGEKCDEDLNECEWEPCRNGGTCVNTFGSYRCECADGFEGADCETPRNYCDAINGRPCKNGGTCLNNRLNHTCVCMPGFSGDICEIRDDTSCGMECENGGVCDWNSDGPRCACSLAFTGRLCEIALPDPCAHDYCGSNGMCFPANDYSSYQCACNPGFSGEHCEIRECTEDPCVMSVRHCQEKEITCGGHGRCIDIEDDYRCICDKHFTGRHCELMSAESSLLSGDVLLFLVGNRENVITRLGDILSGIGRVLHVNVRVHLDENDRPMVYAWDSEKGKGEPLEEVGNFIDIHDKSLFYKAGGRHRRSAKLEGALLYLQIDISPCHEAQRFDRNLTCPHSVRDVALELATNTVLGPLGFSVHKADFEQPTSERTSPLVFGLVGGDLPPRNGRAGATRPWARKKPSYRDANVVSVTGQFNPPLMKDEQSSVCSMFNQQYPQQHAVPSLRADLPARSLRLLLVLTPQHSTSASTGSYSPLPDDPDEPKNVHDPNLDPLLHRIIFETRRENEKECLERLKDALQSGQGSLTLLHSYGADASLRDRDGRTAFHFAIERGHPNGAAWLLDNTPVDFAAVSRGSYTALKLCALPRRRRARVPRGHLQAEERARWT
ncbi:hypothetical protein M3Y99_01143100 [Aphelenchoides fujianensis]|nr:hypothetical protein M3Y99_01143100 [Aphelenchoides fujianensis]